VVALNGDIVSYSQLLAEDHDSTRAIVEAFQQLVTGHISANNGTLVNFVGDNFMAVFSNVSEALQTAISVTSEIERRDPRISSSEKVRFRLGLDSGEVSIADQQYYGDVLNIAARIQTMAKAGGICVSGKVGGAARYGNAPDRRQQTLVPDRKSLFSLSRQTD
jgi:class 3 adenylate cyclase